MSSDELNEICRLLSKQVANTESRVNVAVETGPDEGMLIGTADGYLRLALVFVEFAQRAQEGTSKMYGLGDTMVAGAWFGDICASGDFRLAFGWLARDEIEQKRITAYFERLSPQVPVTQP